MSRRIRSKRCKGYSQEERVSLTNQVIETVNVRCNLGNLRPEYREDLKSYAGLVLSDWFNDENWRPYDPSKGKTLKGWLNLIVDFSIKDYIRQKNGKRTPNRPDVIIVNWCIGAGVEDEDLKQVPYIEDDYIRLVEARQSVEEIMSICSKKQKEVLNLMLQGYNRPQASRKLGKGESYAHYIFSTIQERVRKRYG